MSDCDTDDYSTEDGKRKREYSPRETRPSKKAQRTHTKKISIENDIEELKSMLKTVVQDVKDIKTDQKAYQEEIRSIREENAKMREKLLALERKVERIEKKERKNNIVIKELETDGTNIKEKAEEFLKNQVGVEVGLESVYQVQTQKSNPLIIAKVNNWQEKMLIMKNKKNLKGSKKFIEDDMTSMERETQWKLRQIARENRAMRKRAKVMYQKIIIDGEGWKWNPVDEVLVREKTDERAKN
ncbi:hypothetical protein Zmor_002067 [Zophobas morio]|uniref:Uncharacterized protein n=1 Tax=Zophobas morio TaxID=2755281 RepID=A0AA38IZV1_9CUCU|nr:hypothetical protein Zmor_002067 [Zophobas morio]